MDKNQNKDIEMDWRVPGPPTVPPSTHLDPLTPDLTSFFSPDHGFEPVTDRLTELYC